MSQGRRSAAKLLTKDEARRISSKLMTVRGIGLSFSPGTNNLIEAFSSHVRVSTAKHEVKMKRLAIVAALLVGGASLAVAQGPPTGGYPPVSGGAAGNPATNPVTPGPPGPGVIPSTRSHKGSKMNTTK
jgi:hypothetical protein